MSLDRRTPLIRKTPLRAASGLASGSRPLARSATLKPRSAARERAYAAPGGRRDLVREMLAAHPTCQAQVLCSGARAVDVHERLKRSRGGSILDPIQAHMVTVCRTCHDWTEHQPREAERRRLLLPSWHRCPPVGPC